MQHFKLLLVVALMLILGGCIHDDLKDCPTINLTFSYFADEGEEVIEDYIHSGKLFIYDEQGALVCTQAISNDKLGKGKYVSLALPTGKYTAICWGNAEANTVLTNTDQMNLARLSAHGYGTSTPISTNDPLYWGQKEITVASNPDRQKVELVQMHSAHIKLDIRLKGLQHATATIHVHSLQPEVDFINDATTAPLTTYIPQVVEKDNIQRAFLHVLRFGSSNTIQVEVFKNQQAESLKVDLNEILRENDLFSLLSSSREEITLTLLIEFFGLDAEVTIPAWDQQSGNFYVD